MIASKFKLAFDFKTGNIPDDLNGMFKYSNDVHPYMTCCSINKGLFIPSIQSILYGIKTLKFSVPVTRNNFSSLNSQLNDIKNHFQLNTFLRKYVISRYGLGVSIA